MNVLDALGSWGTQPGPLYQKLATALENAVIRGDLAPGTVLPAERQLARSLSVGRSTVVGAYDLLRSQGVLISRQGSGSWVAGAERKGGTSDTPESLPSAALANAGSLVDLATASLPAAPAVREALAALNEAVTEELLAENGYTAHGLGELRLAVANQFCKEGLPTSADQILITTGGQQALALITQHFPELGDAVVVEDPTSPGVLDLLRTLPVVIRSCPSLSAAGPNPLTDVVRKANPALIYLHTQLGPEGLSTPANDLKRLAEQLRNYPGVIVEDTSSRHLLQEAELPPYLASVSNLRVVTIGSMSKLFWGGLRVGWIRSDESLALRLARAKARTDLGTPVLSQLCSAWLLHRFPEIRAQRIRELEIRATAARAILADKLPEFEIQDRAGGPTFWVKMPRGASRPFVEVARRHGVAVVAGDALSAGGTSDGHLRLSLGHSTVHFDDGIERLARAWLDYDAHPHTALAAPDDTVLV